MLEEFTLLIGPLPWLGGLNAIFERIVSDPEIQRLYTPDVVLQDPWIITLDNFVKPDEIEGIIAVTSTDFERSSSVCL